MSQSKENKKAANIAKRNRENAKKSTGPRTAEGKSVSRLNSLKHGMTANPAVGAIEDPEQFDRLYQQLVQQVGPMNVIEEKLVSRIAVSLWRLERATKAESALIAVSAQSVITSEEQIQGWINKINKAWDDVRFIEEEIVDRDIAGKKRPRPRGQRRRYQAKFLRPGLQLLDEMWEDMHKNPYAIKALTAKLDVLTDIIQDRPFQLAWSQAQQLAWLLGQPAASYHEQAETLQEQEGKYFPDEKAWSTGLDQLIGEARKREAGKPLPSELRDYIHRKRDFWHTRYRMLLDRAPGGVDAVARLATLLPDQSAMDRLLRYEKHANSNLYQSIEALAKLRGASVQTFFRRVICSSDQPMTAIESDPVETHDNPTLLEGQN